MKISKKSEYAIRALIELSLNYDSEKKIGRDEISQKQNIPLNFLSHILVALRNAGLIISSRGAVGGYLLAKSPQDISLCEVIKLFEGKDKVFSCCGDRGKQCAGCPYKKENCPFPSLFNKIDLAFYSMINKYTIQDFVAVIENRSGSEFTNWVI